MCVGPAEDGVKRCPACGYRWGHAPECPYREVPSEFDDIVWTVCISMAWGGVMSVAVFLPIW